MELVQWCSGGASAGGCSKTNPASPGKKMLNLVQCCNAMWHHQARHYTGQSTACKHTFIMDYLNGNGICSTYLIVIGTKDEITPQSCNILSVSITNKYASKCISLLKQYFQDWTPPPTHPSLFLLQVCFRPESQLRVVCAVNMKLEPGELEEPGESLFSLA